MAAEKEAACVEKLILQFFVCKPYIHAVTPG
jgi:hypothetical protein